MKKNNTKILEKRKRKIAKRLERKQWKSQEKPMFAASNIHYEIDGRHEGIACGGIGAIHLMNKKTGFIDEIDSVLHLLKVHLPYHESDHVLNIAYNVIAGGTRLEDIELHPSWASSSPSARTAKATSPPSKPPSTPRRR